MLPKIKLVQILHTRLSDNDSFKKKKSLIIIKKENLCLMSVFISVYDTDKAKFFTPKTSPNLNIGARMS